MKRIALVYVALFTAIAARSQNTKNEIDGLFSTWEKTNNPGGVVWVSYQNQLVFSKAYGLANIPYNIPNDLETKFNIGSVSKQFTAMGIVLLQLDGKLSVDDSIQKYLPEMHQFEKAITIRQLLHHTSGIRSSPELFGLAGWRDGDAITNEDVYRYLTKQVDLNFEPGSEYMYSNSGYILLSKIIENVTKQDFKSWMKEHVFQALQLNSTCIEEDHSNILSKTASSYSEMEPGVFKSIENTDMTYGASNVYTTGADLIKWSNQFYKTSKAWENAFALLKTLDVLNSGTKNTYAFGVMLDDFFGNQRVQHTGGVAGFHAIMYCYPEENLEIVILSNFTSGNLSRMADQISQLYLQNKSKPESNDVALNPLLVKPEVLKKLQGMYWNDKSNFSRKIYFENDTLWYLRTNSKKSPLIPIAENEFQMGGLKEFVRVKFEENVALMTLIFADNSIDTLEKYDDQTLTTEDLKAYTGTFYSTELETSYEISLKNGKLVGYHSRFGEFEIQILKKDIVSWSGMAVSKYQRNKNDAVIGLKITMNRLRNVWFEKK